MKKVAIIMGSASDREAVLPAAKQLKELGVPFEWRIMSAHRTPDAAAEFSARARENGFGAIIAAAGMAAHLAGAAAARTTLPVIALPLRGGMLDGLDALLASVQMPPGIPVATVAVGGAKNAALLACQILSVEDKELAEKLDALRREAADTIAQKDKELQRQDI